MEKRDHSFDVPVRELGAGAYLLRFQAAGRVRNSAETFAS